MAIRDTNYPDYLPPDTTDSVPPPPPAAPPPSSGAWYGSDPAKKDANDQIVAAYQKFLGRTPSEQEVLGQLSGGRRYAPANIQAALNAIRFSTEAQQYATDHPATTTSGAGAGGGGDTPPPPGSSKTAMPGWDQTKWDDPTHTNEKYTVGRILSGYAPSPENLTKAMADIEKAYPGAKQVGKDSIFLPGLGTIDVGGNFSSGKNMSWYWGPSLDVNGQSIAGAGAASGAGAGTGTTGGAAGAGAAGTAGTPGATSPTSFYEAPPPFNYPEFVPPEFQTPAFTAPAPFSYADFTAPSGEAVLAQDPGYQFRVKEGERALTNAASASGLLRTGGTLKDLMNYASGLASQEYGTAYGRSFNDWSANRAAKASDYDTLWKNLLSDYMVKYNAESDLYSRNLSTYQTNLGKATTGYGYGLDVAAGKAGGQQGAYNNLAQLYDISTRNLPTYQPTQYSPSQWGYPA